MDKAAETEFYKSAFETTFDKHSKVKKELRSVQQSLDQSNNTIKALKQRGTEVELELAKKKQEQEDINLEMESLRKKVAALEKLGKVAKDPKGPANAFKIPRIKPGETSKSTASSTNQSSLSAPQLVTPRVCSWQSCPFGENCSNFHVSEGKYNDYSSNNPCLFSSSRGTTESQQSSVSQELEGASGRQGERVHERTRSPRAATGYSALQEGQAPRSAEESPCRRGLECGIGEAQEATKILFNSKDKYTNSKMSRENSSNPKFKTNARKGKSSSNPKNFNSKGKMKLIHWNKGSSRLENKFEDLELIFQEYQPHILGLSEANLYPNTDIKRVEFENYTLHTCSTIHNPELGVSRVVVYTHNSLTVKRRPDLENDNISSIWLEVGHKGAQ